METGLMINKLSNCLRRRSAEIQRSVGVSGSQGAILDYILVETAHGTVCQRDIEQEFGLRPSTATEVLKALEKSQLIRRVPDPEDARRKNIVFLPQADAVCAALQAEITQTEELLLRDITPQEKEQFLRIAHRMLQNLEGQSG